MPRGGHPKSGPVGADAEQRDLMGSKTRRRHRDRERVVVTLGVPTKPRYLGIHGSHEWNRLTRLLTTEGRLCEADRPCLEIAAGTYQSAREIHTQLEKETSIGSDQWVRLARAERLAWQLYQKALNDLCLTAATRVRAPKGQKEKPNDLLEFLRRRSNPSDR